MHDASSLSCVRRIRRTSQQKRHALQHERATSTDSTALQVKEVKDVKDIDMAVVDDWYGCHYDAAA
jgi:hypothetical protein